MSSYFKSVSTRLLFIGTAFSRVSFLPLSIWEWSEHKDKNYHYSYSPLSQPTVTLISTKFILICQKNIFILNRVVNICLSLLSPIQFSYYFNGKIKMFLKWNKIVLIHVLVPVFDNVFDFLDCHFRIWGQFHQHTQVQLLRAKMLWLSTSKSLTILHTLHYLLFTSILN